jgi:hypothetical protein
VEEERVKAKAKYLYGFELKNKKKGSAKVEIEHLKNTLLQQQAAVDMKIAKSESDHMRQMSKLQETHRLDMVALRDELKTHYSGQLRQALLKMKDRYVGSLRALAPDINIHATAPFQNGTSSFYPSVANTTASTATATSSPGKKERRRGRHLKSSNSSPNRSRSPSKASREPSYAQSTMSSRARSPSRVRIQ